MDVGLLNREEGYTVVESLVAMTLFVSVLIPLGAFVGNTLLSSDTSCQRKALSIAESELSTALESFNPISAERTRDGFVVAVQSELSERLNEVTVSVSHASNTEKILVTLHKTVQRSKKQQR